MVRTKQAALSMEKQAALAIKVSQKPPAHRHRKTVADIKSNFKKPQLRKMFRRAGSKRISGGCYDIARQGAVDFMRHVLNGSLTIKEHKKRVELNPSDVRLYLKLKGYNFYGIENKQRHFKKESKRGGRKKKSSETPSE